MFTDNYDSSFCFSVFEKRLTEKNCFLFCKSMVCLTVIFFNNQKIVTGQHSGGIRSQYFIPEAELFQPWRGFVQRTCTQTGYFRLMVPKALALIYRFSLYLNPVKVQCYRITHVHNYYSIPSMTVFGKSFI